MLERKSRIAAAFLCKSFIQYPTLRCHEEACQGLQASSLLPIQFVSSSLLRTQGVEPGRIRQTDEVNDLPVSDHQTCGLISVLCTNHLHHAPKDHQRCCRCSDQQQWV